MGQELGVPRMSFATTDLLELVFEPDEESQSFAGTQNKVNSENGAVIIPEKAKIRLESYKNKKRLTAEKIMMAIVLDSHVTIPRLAKMSGSSIRTVKRYLKEFQQANVLRREGSDTSGEWILI